jgi:hypothetical protein
MDLLDLTPPQLNRAAANKERIAALTKELTKLLGASDNGQPTRRRHESALPEGERLRQHRRRDGQGCGARS